ncbi:MAG: YqeG family HAD IIIA-type phosphatase, partial [Clostridia bacterium]|nr:YqeG family HAD IIIA-type phosphatase [Clostridia bacterium]
MFTTNENYTPDYNYERITDITPAAIRRMGVKAIALDLDNTVLPYGSLTVDSKVVRWVKTMESAGIRVAVVSNALAARTFIISRQLGKIPFYPLSLKPRTYALRFAAKKLNVSLNEIAMIGDKISTDVAAANRAGSVAVKVEPIKEVPSFNILIPRVIAALSASIIK